MIFSGDVLFQIAIFILATAGFFVANHIRHHKVNNKVLVCPMNMDCHGVVHSDYSTFFGIHLEIFGMIYYAFIALSYLVFIFLPNIMPNYLIGIMAGLSICALLFSVYLVSIMAFVLKKGCYWCLVSAAFCLLIFIFTLMTYDFSALTKIFGGGV